MKTAGILKDNNTLSQDSPPAERPLEQVEINGQVNPNRHEAPQSPASTPGGYLTVKLPSGLIVQYEQQLASAFAFGQFGIVLKGLDDAVAKYLKGQKSTEKTQEQKNEQS